MFRFIAEIIINYIKINFNFNFIADKSRNQLLKGTKRPYTVDKERERRKGEREKKENKWLYICKNNTMKKIKLVFHQLLQLFSLVLDR